jgi:hypothetical protein
VSPLSPLLKTRGRTCARPRGRWNVCQGGVRVEAEDGGGALRHGDYVGEDHVGFCLERRGFVTLIARVRPFTPTVVVLEATGGYEVTVAAALAGARLPVAVVNPRQIATSRGPPGSWPRPMRSTLG